MTAAGAFMFHKGVAYEIMDAARPSYKWVVHFNDGRLKSGIESSKGKAIFKAVRVIDEAEAASWQST